MRRIPTEDQLGALQDALFALLEDHAVMWTATGVDRDDATVMTQSMICQQEVPS